MYLSPKPPSSSKLDYAVSTTPSPLQVTPAGMTSTSSTITVVMSNDTGETVSCDTVSFRFSQGKGASDLTEHLDTVSYRVSPPGVWSLSYDDDNSSFVATSQRGQVEIDKNGFAFEFTDIAVNGRVGVTELNIEDSTGSINFIIGKFPYGFYFGDFRPTFLDQDPARSAINAGDPVTLTWNGSEGAEYYILYDNNDPVNVTKVRRWPEQPLKISRDTTFFLKAQLTSDGNSIEHTIATSIRVMNPVVTPSRAYINAPKPGDTWYDYVLYTDGPTWLNGQTWVGNSDNTQNLHVYGDVTADGALTAGTGRLLGSYVTLWAVDNDEMAQSRSGTVARSFGPAPTDGFLLGWCTLYGWYDETTAIRIGVDSSPIPYGLGTTVSNPATVNSESHASFVAPMPAGSSFRCWVTSTGNSTYHPYAPRFSWIPLGGGVPPAKSEAAELIPELLPGAEKPARQA